MVKSSGLAKYGTVTLLPELSKFSAAAAVASGQVVL